MTGWIVGSILLITVGLSVVIVNVAMRKHGYSVPGKTVVRCSKGHLFTTNWVAGGSMHAVRLTYRTRYQRCPIGRHWAIIHLVKDADLTEDDRREVDRGIAK